jgi:DNA polymerase
VARQHLKTDLLLGVDFIPLRPRRQMEQPAHAAAALVRRPVEIDIAVDSSMRGDAVRSEKDRLLEMVRRRHDAECGHCTVATHHTQTVFGEGDPDADLMFIGEAPGEQEDRTGRPFVGRAGEKLNDILKAMGLAREAVYIANVLKSRPPDNRTPLPDEIAHCSPFLVEQIRIIEPRVVVTLGGPATKLLLNTRSGIMSIRGQWASYVCAERVIPVMPTFHPAYLLRNYTRETRQQVWDDMRAVLARLGMKPP